MKSIRRVIRFPVYAAFLLLVASPRPAKSQESGEERSTHENLAKQLQNPFANLIAFPLQNITYLDIGRANDHANVLNLQPVYPIAIDKNWNLLVRPILPLSYTSVPTSTFGLGDFSLEPFLSPQKANAVTWGLGPILGIPTATDDVLGSGKWTAGPNLALFVLMGRWAFSMITNQQWSYAGDPARNAVSLLQIQPTLTLLLRHGLFITSGPLISADWKTTSGQRWTVPLGAGVGHIVAVGGQKLNLQLEGYAVPIRPDDGPKGLLIVTATLLFPR